VLYQLLPNPDGTFAPKRIWQNRDALLTKFSNVSIKDGFVYGLSEGTLECVDLATGEVKWSEGDYRYGQMLRVGDLLLVLHEMKGTVSLVEATPERANHVLATIDDALSGKTWNNLALYGPYLLVRNAKWAACFELPVE
jgi:outer membrane protein assembly factor BamB